MQPVFCEECGAAVNASARFCIQCGSVQPAEVGAAVPTEARGPQPQARPALPQKDRLQPDSGAVASDGGGSYIHRSVSTPVGPAAEAGRTGSAPASAGATSPALHTDLGPSIGVTPARADFPEPSQTPTRRTTSSADPHYTLCAIREVGPGAGDIEEGLLFPVPMSKPDTVAVEARDGADVKMAKCTAIEVAVVGEKKPVLRASNIRAQVMLTDARLTIACSRFDKGGGWWGWGWGALLTLPLNIASHALAARRRRGKMLVGQVRFPWVDAVYAQSRLGMGGVEKLRMVVNAGGRNQTRGIRVDLTFPKNVDAAAIGTELIRRAATFRLTHDPQPCAEDERAQLLELCRVDPIVNVKGSGKMAGHEFPAPWPASDQSARFGLDPMREARA